MTFNKADILLPDNIDMNKWSVVACDQYTSEPAYWKAVEDYIGSAPSAYELILPEIYLENDDVADRIKDINDNMLKFLDEGVFAEYKASYVYIERTLRNGMLRQGIIGAVDLEDYDYSKGSKSAVRATEGTVPERIPPRLSVRLNAKLELPHVMLLIDDRKKHIIDTISEAKSKMQKLYDFDLMMDSGHISAWLLNAEMAEFLENELSLLADIGKFNDKYGVNEEKPLVFAVGDGNHSLATAKEYYNLQKEKYGASAENSPARYALAELVNLHDDSLVFEAIHRVVFDIDTDDFINELSKCTQAAGDDTDGQKFLVLSEDFEAKLLINEPTANLTVGSVQNFIDKYIAEKGGRVDYIHGDDVVRELAKAPNTCGIILDAMDKNDLYKTVILDGALPRKTFSMGDACDKRFYNEARIINNNI